MELTPPAALAFIDAALDRMLVKAREAGPRVAERPDLPGANSVYALVTHSLGVCEFWLGHIVLGEASDRDRDSEFEAVGSLSELEASVDAFRLRLPEMVARVAETPSPHHDLSELEPWPWTTDAVVLHVVEELYQHLGHIDLTVDLLTR